MAMHFSRFCEKKNSTSVQTTNTAISLPDEVINVVSLISNSETPWLVLSDANLTKLRACFES